MSNEDKDVDFFHPLPFSLRAINPEWIEHRAKELAALDNMAEPDVQGALGEVFEQLMARTGANYDPGREPFVYMPDLDGQPYVIMLPIRAQPSSKRPMANIPTPKFAPNPNNKRSSLRLDFEASVFEIDPDLTKSDLARDVNGLYKNAQVRSLWAGFKHYHNKFTQAKSSTFRENYNKTLGRYVVAKVGTNGVALFNRAPFRHMTMDQALEEATRLSIEHSDGFAVFRCMDIVGKPQGE